MYNFVDDVAGVSGTSDLPAEAMSINGVCIEKQIEGYRTLYVEGRETLESEVVSKSIGQMNGERYQYKRDVSRKIVVHYQLMSDSVENFRKAFNQLCYMLDGEQMKLIFADEPDKYFIGTKSEVSQPDTGQLNVIGDFTIYCADPYKYALEETEVTGRNRTLTLVNNGTKATPVSIETMFTSESGYIGYALEDSYYQIGDPEEVDGVPKSKSVKLFDDHMFEDKGWTLNDGIVPPASGSDGTTGIGKALQVGSVRYVWDHNYVDKVGRKEGYTEATSYGSGVGWHGPSLTKTITPVENQYPVNWTANWRFDFNNDGLDEKTKPNGVGHNSWTFSDEDGNIICSVGFEDTTPTKEDSNMFIYIGDKRVFDERHKGKKYYVSITKDMRRDSGASVTVSKMGNKITVKFRKINKTYTLSDDAAAKTLRKITWYGASLGANYKAINNLNFRAMNVVMHNVNYVEDIPNYFQKGSTVYIDGKSNEVYVNGSLDWDRVDIGSTPLMLPPGQHTLGVAVSTFADQPYVKAIYRERWI